MQGNGRIKPRSAQLRSRHRRVDDDSSGPSEGMTYTSMMEVFLGPYDLLSGKVLRSTGCHFLCICSDPESILATSQEEVCLLRPHLPRSQMCRR